MTPPTDSRVVTPSIDPAFQRFGALVWAVLVVTTLLNTTLYAWAPAVGLSSAEADVLRDQLLIGHAVLGLLASWVITLALYRVAPGAAGAAFVFAFVEKAAELVGQILIVFTLHGAWRASLVAVTDAAQRAATEAKISMFLDVWDDTFLVFWVGALLSNLFWLAAAWRLGAPGRALQGAFAVMSLLALALILQGYAGQDWIGTLLPVLYPLLLGAARAYVAWWLWTRAATGMTATSRGGAA